MKKSYRKMKILLMLVLISMYILTAVVLNMMGFTFKDTPANYVMNYGFLILMTAMVNVSMKRGFGIVAIYTVQLDILLKKIKEIEKDHENDEKKEIQIRQEILKENNTLTERKLREQYENFINAYEAGNITCNIEDYINFEQLTEKLPIRFCENLPSLLTALGILGTFIGLIYGFMQFNYSNIEMSIQQFIAGVSVAFFTSVYGIALSSVMNYIGNELEERFEEKLILLENKFSFYQIFHKERNMWEIMLNEMKQINRNFGGVYQEGMKDSIVESFEIGNKNLIKILKDWRNKQEREIYDLSKGIVTELKNTTTTELKETRDTVKEMNQLVGTLSDSIIELSDYTNDLMQEIRRFMEEIKITNDNAYIMNQSITDKIQDYENQMANSISRMAVVGKDIKQSVENVGQIIELQSKDVENLIIQGNAFVQFENDVLRQQDEMMKEWKNVAGSFQQKSRQLERERKAAETIMQEQQKKVEEQKEVINEYQKKLKIQFEEMIRLLNLKAVEISAKNSGENVKAESEKLRRMVEKIKEGIDGSGKNNQEFLDEVMEQMRIIQSEKRERKGIENYSEIEAKIEEQSQIIIAEIQKMMDQHTFTGKIKKILGGNS